METMNNPTLYHPAAALLVFKPEQSDNDLYIEYYDIDSSGCPVNPRPLSVQEAMGLAKALSSQKSAATAFLKPKGIIPATVLHINLADTGSVVWYTKANVQQLHFTESLKLPSAAIALPALVWRADRKHLSVYALKGKGKPSLATPLFYAPFFNLYRNGNVCMGTVNVQIKTCASLEAFTAAWQGYFFGSFFSHLIDGHNPIGGNLVSLYKKLMGTGEPFPIEMLQPCRKQLKDLLV